MTRATVIAFVLLFLAGCASDRVNGYFDVGAGYRFDEYSDVILRQAAGFECDRLTSEFALGAEFAPGERFGGYCEIYHWSHWFCGGPFADGEPELYELRARCAGRVRFW